MTTEASRYGRSSDEWALLAERATAFLIEQAKLRISCCLPSRASKAAKEAFWVGQVGAVHEFYARNALADGVKRKRAAWPVSAAYPVALRTSRS